MLMSRKIRILPTPEQEILFKKSAGVSRWAFNYYLSECDRVYDEYLKNNKQGKSYPSEQDVRKYINNNLKKTTHTWLKEVSAEVMKQAVKDADQAMKSFFNKIKKGQIEYDKHGNIKGKLHRRLKHKHGLRFYVYYDTFKKTSDGFYGQKIGNVKTTEKLPDLLPGTKYSNPHISYDGKYWYLSVSYETKPKKCKLNDNSIGIDLGIKDLAICSNGKVYKNINKTKKMKKLAKKLKREQRKLSRKLTANIDHYEKDDKGYNHPVWKRNLSKCKNIQKQKKLIKSINRRISNIRRDYAHQVTTEIVKTKPSRIVMEDLDVSNMLKNRHLAKAISEQGFYRFKQMISYKSEKYGIELKSVSRFYPSSKTCSCCGNIKHDLKLSDRTYHCNNCGLIIDRDYNASINLANYKFA